MQHDLTGPLWGNIIIIALAGAVSIACFVAMFWMLIRPGERDPKHPKFGILRTDGRDKQ